MSLRKRLRTRRGGGGGCVGRGRLWSPVQPLGCPWRIDLSLIPMAGDHKGPLPAQPHPRPYGSSVAFSLLAPIFPSLDASWTGASPAVHIIDDERVTIVIAPALYASTLDA